MNNHEITYSSNRNKGAQFPIRSCGQEIPHPLQVKRIWADI